MGVKMALAAAVGALCAAPSALAQKSTADGLRDCKQLAAIKLKQKTPTFNRFEIDRADVDEHKFGK
jgi:hypothetical protein